MDSCSSGSGILAAMPFYSKYSDEMRSRLDREYLSGVRGGCSFFGLEENGYVFSAYKMVEPVAIGHGGITIPIFLRTRFLRFVCDSLYWVDDHSLEACLFFLDEKVREYGVDRLHFHYFRPSSWDSWLTLRRKLQDRGYLAIEHKVTKLYRCDISTDSVQPSLRLKSKNRYKERKKLKGLGEEVGDVSIVCYRYIEQADEFFAAIRTLSGETWQKKSNLGTVVDTDQFRRIYKLESGLGRLRSYVLYAGEKPVAYQFGTVYEGTYHYEYIGYDGAFKEYSPGQLLRMHSFDEMHADPALNWVDFGHVEFDFKKQWSTESIDLPDVSFYRKTLGGLAAYLAERVTMAMKSMLRR